MKNLVKDVCIRSLYGTGNVMLQLLLLKKWKITGGIIVASGMTYFNGVRGRCFSSSQPTLFFDHSLTLYQYHSCPYCCKTRAFLDYYGIPYNKVEVNPLFRSEIKFSKYRKVPFLIASRNSSSSQQINDSNVIISALRTCMVLKCTIFEALQKYPEMVSTDEKGKEVTETANKYFIMYGEVRHDDHLSQLREEREWREWVDTKMIHTLSPNIYRTPKEALRAFDYISSVGNFKPWERTVTKYVGALAMYIIGKRLKKKWKLKDNERQSLYDCCNKWTKAIGKHRTFMGGEKPNLADLAVYGILNAIEGLDTFNDVMEHTKIQSWYYAVKERVQKQEGRDAY